jgi:hypothetical protein
MSGTGEAGREPESFTGDEVIKTPLIAARNVELFVT